MNSLCLIDGPYGLSKYPGDEIRTEKSSSLYAQVFTTSVVLKVDHVIVFGSFDSLSWIHVTLSRFLSGYALRADCVWEKPDWVHGGTKTFAPRHEMFLHYALPAARFNCDSIRVPYGERASKGVNKKAGRTIGWTPNPLGARRSDILRFTGERLVSKVEGRTQANKHPCEKPKALLEVLVLACSDMGGKVYEPFVGSPNLKEVCEKQGRYYYGYSNAEDFKI